MQALRLFSIVQVAIARLEPHEKVFVGRKHLSLSVWIRIMRYLLFHIMLDPLAGDGLQRNGAYRMAEESNRVSRSSARLARYST